MATFASSFATKIGDNIYVFNGLTDNDITAIKNVIAKAAANGDSITQLQGDLDALELKVASINKGQATLAYKDLATAENQAGMESGVYYKVPYTKEGTFIDLTSEETQNGAEVDHLDIYFKGADGTVKKVGSESYKASFTDLASLAGNNKFTGDNEFKSVSITEEQDAGTLTDSKVAKYGTVKAHVSTAVTSAVSAAKTDVLGQVEAKKYLSAEVVEEYPESASMTEGKLYLKVSADHFTE